MRKENKSEKASNTIGELSARKIGDITEAQAVFCSLLKCFVIAGEDDMADKALNMLLIDLKMKPDMIIKTIKDMKLSEGFIAYTLAFLRNQRFIDRAFRELSVN